jgi:hypothetical protein
MRFPAHAIAALAVIPLSACFDLGPDEPDEASTVESALGGHRDPVRVHAILTANDDGTQAATAKAADIQAAVAEARTILAAANIELTFDPESDITRMNSTLLNHDCIVAPGTNLSTPKNMMPAQDCKVTADERDRVALEYPGKLVVYFSSGDQLFWSDSAMQWVYGPRGFNWSNHVNHFVAMASGWPSGEVLAHEMGHYLHLVHTMFPMPTTLAEAATLIRDHIENNGLPTSRGLEIFDNDGLTDTPPDPGQGLFSAAGLDPCDPNDDELPLQVTFTNGTTVPYLFAPDRENIMSYWNKTCRGLPAHVSPQQIAIVRTSLEQQNRQHLIAPKFLYSAVWEPGEVNQTRAIGWAFLDFADRMKLELEDRHLVHMQAYNIGENQIRWDGVWEPESRGQSWVLGWAFADIAKQQQAELAAGNHLVHMQAYDLGGGQIRWDAVWEPGSTGQNWVMGWAMVDFAKVFNQMTAAGMHVVHMQAYDLGGGQLRWDAVWEPGNRNTTRAIGWAMKDFALRFNQEIAAGKHCVHMQAYDIGGGQIRWDGVWEDGVRDTSRAIGWAFNDFVGRLQQETAAGRELVHMQAYDVGYGQVRYDAVWEQGKTGQHRILSESIYKFAARFDDENASGMRMVMMQAHTGR